LIRKNVIKWPLRTARKRLEDITKSVFLTRYVRMWTAAVAINKPKVVKMADIWINGVVGWFRSRSTF
jgi:hypothetical protein